jgi:predicted NBD/HSP70 family sugar kinase
VSEPLLAAVEIGGTKTLVAIGTGPMAILQQERLPTEGPEATLGRVAAILRTRKPLMARLPRSALRRSVRWTCGPARPAGARF